MCQTSSSFDETFINWQIGKKCCNVFLELNDIEKRAEQNETFLDLLLEEGNTFSSIKNIYLLARKG